MKWSLFIFLSFSGGLELHVNNYISRVQTEYGANKLKCDFEEGENVRKLILKNLGIGPHLH